MPTGNVIAPIECIVNGWFVSSAYLNNKDYALYEVNSNRVFDIVSSNARYY
jgi:hypothetical protein